MGGVCVCVSRCVCLGVCVFVCICVNVSVCLYVWEREGAGAREVSMVQRFYKCKKNMKPILSMAVNLNEI